MKAGRSNPPRRQAAKGAVAKVGRLPCPRKVQTCRACRWQNKSAVSQLYMQEFEALFAALDQADCGYLTTQQVLKGFELLGFEITDEGRSVLPERSPAKGYSIQDFERFVLGLSARLDPSILTIQACGAGAWRSMSLKELLQFGADGLSDQDADEVIQCLQKEGLASEVMPAMARMFQLNRRLSMFS